MSNSKLEQLFQKYEITSTGWNDTDFGNGWIPLIDNLFSELIKLGWNKKLDQIKEKFGQLNCYISTYDENGQHPNSEQINKLISDIENQSIKICENCGKPGKRTNKNYWIRTLCESCDTI